MPWSDTVEEWIELLALVLDHDLALAPRPKGDQEQEHEQEHEVTLQCIGVAILWDRSPVELIPRLRNRHGSIRRKPSMSC